ncbi:DUF5058 family protein [Peptoniphilus asaccharolyticus]
MDINKILNGRLLYSLVAIGLISIFLMCLFFYKRAYKRAIELNISKDKIKSVIKSSAVFSMVPSISIIIGLITLKPLLGAPWPWFRLSVVGSLPYELTAADLSVKGSGYNDFLEFQKAGDLKAIGTIMFVMSIAIMAGMIFNIFFLKKLHTSVSTSGGKETPFRDLALSVLITGMMSVFVVVQITKSKIHAITVLVSAFITFILTYLAKKLNVRWLNDYVMSFALIIGMVVAVVLTRILV